VHSFHFLALPTLFDIILFMMEEIHTYRFTIKQIFKEHWEGYSSQHNNSLRQDNLLAKQSVIMFIVK